MRARPSGVGKRSANSRGVPGCGALAVGGRRARPEQPGRAVGLVGVEPGVAQAAVVGGAAGAGARQLVEHLGGVGREAAVHARAARRGRASTSSSDRTPVGRRQRTTAAQHAPLERGHRPLLLRPLGDGQHDVGQPGRLGRHEVAHDEQVERGEPLAHRAGVRRADHEVAAVDEQRARAGRGAEATQQLDRGDAGAGQVVRVDAPDAGDVRAGRRVVDLAVPGQLVGLLPVLAPALPVALPGDRAVPAARPAGQPEGEREVDRGGDRGGALRALLGAAAGEHVRARGPRATGDAAASRRATRRSSSARDAADAARPAPATTPRRCAGRRRRRMCAPRGSRRRRGPRPTRRAAARAAPRGRCPGTGCRCTPPPSSVRAAVDECRGSTTTRPPAARAPARCADDGGMVSATLLPSRRIACAPPRSASGNGSPRSTPNARLAPAAALAMQNRPL